MPATSEKQRRFIWAKRREYGKKKSTPKKWKWIWKPEWVQLKESKIQSFKQFNEGYGTLSNQDMELIDDLFLDLIETWDLKTSINNLVAFTDGAKGYFSLQMFSRFNIEVSIQLYSNFDIDTNLEQFQADFLNIIERIKKNGYEVRVNVWDSRIMFTSTYSLTISHTDEKSQEIFNSNLRTN